MSGDAVFERLVAIDELRRSHRWALFTADEQHSIESERTHLKEAAAGGPLDPELLDRLEQAREAAIARAKSLQQSRS